MDSGYVLRDDYPECTTILMIPCNISFHREQHRDCRGEEYWLQTWSYPKLPRKKVNNCPIRLLISVLPQTKQCVEWCCPSWRIRDHFLQSWLTLTENLRAWFNLLDYLSWWKDDFSRSRSFVQPSCSDVWICQWGRVFLQVFIFLLTLFRWLQGRIFSSWCHLGFRKKVGITSN